MCKQQDTEWNLLCLWTIGLIHWSPEQIQWARRQKNLIPFLQIRKSYEIKPVKTDSNHDRKMQQLSFGWEFGRDYFRKGWSWIDENLNHWPESRFTRKKPINDQNQFIKQNWNCIKITGQQYKIHLRLNFPSPVWRRSSTELSGSVVINPLSWKNGKSERSSTRCKIERKRMIYQQIVPWRDIFWNFCYFGLFKGVFCRRPGPGLCRRP